MLTSTTILAILTLVVSVRGADPICADACLTLATNYAYGGCSDTDENYYACRCISPEFLGTLALCLQEHCSTDEWEWIDVDICQEYGKTAPIESYESVIANATKFAGDPQENATEVLTYPLKFSKEVFDASFDTSADFIGNMTDASFFGWLLCLFAGVLCIFGAVQNHILPLFLNRHSTDIEGPSPSTQPSKLTTLFKKHFLLPATFNASHVHRPFYLSIPLRSQSILIFLYLFLNFIFMCVDYHLFSANLYWPAEENIQLTRYVADRSGILAFAQIPLLIAFAGRNNLLIWLTGWSFQTFNVWHKWVARVCLIHTFVHSVGYTVYAFQEGGAEILALYYQDTYLRWGAVGTVACFLICFQAIYVFRRYWYEIFLIGHIILAIIFLVGCWYHVMLLESGHMEWLYASIALWSFDRFLRLVRIFALNISWSKNRVAGTGKLKIIGTDAIKAKVNVGYNFSFRPGQYIYVYFPRFNFWESHPFTIAEYEVLDGQPIVTLLFRSHGGVTKKLYKHLADGPKEMYCLLEGPYGHYSPVDKYDNVLLLAGGVGVTAVFPYLQYLAKLGVNRVRFIWVVRDEDSMNWLANSISALLPSNNVDIEIHITKSNSGIGNVEETVEKRISLARERISVDLGVKSEDLGQSKPHEIGKESLTNTKEIDSENNSNSEITSENKSKESLAANIFVGSKPCLREVIGSQCAEMVGSLAVLACGLDTFVDETRRAVGENITRAKGVVNYFEESFTW